MRSPGRETELAETSTNTGSKALNML